MEGFRHHLSKQVAMNILVPLTVALLLSVAAASLFAQDGTAPEGMGSTGWTSASRAQTGAAMSANRSDPEAAPQQPFIATGADLNGAHTGTPWHRRTARGRRDNFPLDKRRNKASLTLSGRQDIHARARRRRTGVVVHATDDRAARNN